MTVDEPPVIEKKLGKKSAQSNMNGILHSLVKACALGEEMGTPVLIPAHWEEALDEEIKRASAKLNAQQFCILGQSALNSNLLRLAYTISGAGISQHRIDNARFLLIRAQSIPYWIGQRRRDCISAAVALARRYRDMAVVNEGIELWRKRVGGGFGISFFMMNDDFEDLAVDDEKVEETLRFERSQDKYPDIEEVFEIDDVYPDYLSDPEEEEPCDCPACRYRREQEAKGYGRSRGRKR